MRKLIATILLFFIFSTTHYSQEKSNALNNKVAIALAEKLTEKQSKYYDLGDYKMFKVYTDSILTVARANHLAEFEIDAIIRLGVYHKKLDAYELALPYYLQALELTNGISKSFKKRTIILINLGNLYNKIGSYDKAAKVYNEASDYLEKHNGPDIYKMAIYMGLSESATANKNFSKSLAYLEKAKLIGEKLKRDDIIIAALNNIADNHFLLKDYNKSLEYSERAKELYTSEQSVDRRALSNYLIGASLIGLKKYDDAISSLQMAQSTALANGYLKIQMDTHYQLAKAYEKTSDFKKANKQQNNYIKAKEKYLLSLSQAKRIEIEKTLTETEVLLQQQTNYKWLFVIIGTIIIVLLTMVLFRYNQRKKIAELEARQLKEDQELLKNENENLKDKLKALAQKNSTKKTDTTSHKNSFTQEEQKNYIDTILKYMESKKPYLNHEIKQSDIAIELGLSVHLFSEILNVCFEKNFNNFINLYRVDKVKQLIKNPKYKNYKVIAIGYESGFASKTSFNRVFKHLVGTTPKEYRSNFMATKIDDKEL